MASRASGRRDPGPWRPADRPSLLMLDYLETGQFGGFPDGAPGPGGRARPGRARPGGRRRRNRGLRNLGSDVRRLAADGRVLAVAAIVGVALAVLVGTSVPLRSTHASPGRPPMAPSMAPRAPVPASSGTSPSPATPRPGHLAQSRPPQARRTVAAMAPASTGARASASPGPVTSSAAAATRRPAARASAAPATAVVVRFTVTNRGGGVFQGEVQIINDGSRPLASWQVAVALPGDRVIAVANASGVVVNGILLLEPASGASPVPARGGVLDVFFVVVGSQPVSGACTFNQLPCG